MKHIITLGFAATTLAAMVTLTSCSKEANLGSANNGQSSLTGQSLAQASALQSPDRIDAIVKDLAIGSYSLSFDRANAGAGITRTAYGSDNYLVFADPQDLICPDPIRLRYPKVPIWKRPVFVQPTCPDMILDKTKLYDIRELLVKVDPAQFRELKTINLNTGGGFFASQQFLKYYSGLQTDRLDALTKDLDGAKFMIMSAPDLNRGGVFTRNFYGYADLNEIVLKPYKIKLSDLIKPTIKGCFDPLILQTIKERLAKFNPEIYKGLDVSTLPQNKSIGILN